MSNEEQGTGKTGQKVSIERSEKGSSQDTIERKTKTDDGQTSSGDAVEEMLRREMDEAERMATG